MRLFLAIPLADEVRDKLSAVQARLKATGADVKWVEAENFHLTVAFLGDLSEALLPDIEAVCETLAEDATAFRVGVRGASYFPRRGPQIKTLWAGVTEGAEEWKALARLAEEAFAPFGVARGPELVPHLTLGRVRTDREMGSLREAVAAEAETDCGAQNADEIALVQSFLDPRGATYKIVKTWKLV